MSAGDTDLLKDLSPGDREDLLALGALKGLSPGEVLFRLGDEAKGVYLVERGKVNLTLPIRLEGRQEDFLVEERTAGQLLGWSGLVPPYRFTLQAKAAVETELLVLPRSELESFFSQRPEVGYLVFSNLARIVGQRLQVFQAMWLRAVQRGMENQRK